MNEVQNIQSKIRNQEIFLSFKNQLIKDFQLSNFPTETMESLVADYTQIHKAILVLLQHNEFSTRRNLMQLIYRIDISEIQLKQYLTEREHENYFDIIAELIIKRTLQKVILRKRFSNETD